MFAGVDNVGVALSRRLLFCGEKPAGLAQFAALDQTADAKDF